MNVKPSQQFKLLVSCILLLSASSSFAQLDSINNLHSKPAFIVGVAFSPLSLNYGFSAGTNYNVQIGNRSKNIYLLLKGARFNYDERVSSNYPISYDIKGYFIQSGLCYYLKNPYMSDYTSFFCFSVVANKSNHHMQITMQDPNWGTQNVLKLKDNLTYFSYTFDYGILFKAIDKLKVSAVVSLSAINNATPFRTEIYGSRSSLEWFRPSSGFGRLYALNFSVGIHYTL